MRFAIIRKADKDTEQGVMPSDAMLTAMGEYNQELVNAGIMRAGEGLRPTSEGFRVRFSEGVPTVTEGPFTETHELIAGFTIIEVNSREEAIEWAKKWPKLDADGGVELELRQVFEFEDFEQGEGTQLHADLDKRLARQPANTAPYLLFNGKCREAFKFYAECLGGHILGMMSNAEMPEPGCPDGVEMQPDHVAHACLQAGKWLLMGSDAPTGYYEKPQGFSVQIEIDDPEQAELTFNRLAEGGKVIMPFEKTFWAYRFGMLVDRFDVPWMINCNIEC